MSGSPGSPAGAAAACATPHPVYAAYTRQDVPHFFGFSSGAFTRFLA